jgi:site-specific recombinase XerD
MKEYIEYFISYISTEKGAAQSTIHKYRADLKRFQNFLKTNLNISDFGSVKTEHIRNYLSHLKESYNYQTSSIANKVNILKHFFSFLNKAGYIKQDPTCLIKTPPKRRKLPKVLNDIEIGKLLKNPEYNSGYSSKFIIRDKLILTMFIYTGLRKSELLNLNWDDVNLGNNSLFIRNSKNKQSRIIPLHPKVVDLLEKYLGQRLPLKEKALFIGSHGRRLCKCSLDNLFKNYIEKSGLKNKGYTIHTLRHTFATQLLKKDASIFHIKELLGHRGIESTEIYLHLTNKELANSVNRL